MKNKNLKIILIITALSVVLFILYKMLTKEKAKAKNIQKYADNLRFVAEKYMKETTQGVILQAVERNDNLTDVQQTIYDMYNAEIDSGKWAGYKINDIVLSHYDWIMRTDTNILTRLFIKL